jgi:fructose-bisphosphate aldolase class II
MPIANPEVYREMIKRAKDGGFAYPAINVTSSQTLNAAIKGFADAGSDGIIQASTGGAEFWSGQGVKNMVTGAEAMAAFAGVVAEAYDVNIALHTDHCPEPKLATYMEPLVDISIERVKQGKDPLFGSHMWDGSAVPLDKNIEIAKRLYDKCVEANIVLEIEIGVVGGEEDGVVGDIN